MERVASHFVAARTYFLVSFNGDGRMVGTERLPGLSLSLMSPRTPLQCLPQPSLLTPSLCTLVAAYIYSVAPGAPVTGSYSLLSS